MAKKDSVAAEPYVWAENPLKLMRAKKFIADREATGQASFETEADREEAVKGQYLALKGHIKGSRMERPAKKQTFFGGVATSNEDDEEEDDEA